MIWFMVHSKNWKGHAVPESLKEDLLKEMEERGTEGETVCREINSYGIDRGGMCHQDRPWEVFAFYDITFHIPCENVSYFYQKLKELDPRKFGKKIYYKLHCEWNCIVLTSRQRQQLLRSLQMRVDRAEAKAMAFYKSKPATNAILAMAAKASTGLDIPPEVLGPDHHRRFKAQA